MRIEFKSWKQWTRILQAVALLAFALFAQSAHSASKTVLVLGDSLSAEYGLVRGTGWVPLLQKRLQQENIDAAVVNASISGETTIGGKSRLPALLEKFHPSVVVIELGANDGLRGLSLPPTEGNLREMIAASKKINAKVLLVGMRIPPNYGAYYTNTFASLYPRLATETKSPLVPFLFAAIINRRDMFQPDRLHPVAAAQPILLDTVWPYLRPLLK